MVFAIVMNFAIDLHHQFPFMTKEISDEESFFAQIIEEKRILAISNEEPRFRHTPGV